MSLRKSVAPRIEIHLDETTKDLVLITPMQQAGERTKLDFWRLVPFKFFANALLGVLPGPSLSAPRQAIAQFRFSQLTF